MGFGGVWFGWTHVRLVIMELKEATITVIHEEKEKAEMKSLIAMKTNHMTIIKQAINYNTELAFYNHFKELMSSNIIM